MEAKQKETLAEQLFNSVTRQLIARIESGNYTHQDMKNAIEFLKNNSITCDLINPVAVQELLQDMDLPFNITSNNMEAN